MTQASRIGALVALLTLTAGTLWAAAPTAQAKTIRSRAFKYAMRGQNADGSYGHAMQKQALVGKTALLLYCFAASERDYRAYNGPFMDRAVIFLLRHRNPDGSFGAGTERPFATAMAVMALRALEDKSFEPYIERAEAWLKANPLPKADADARAEAVFQAMDEATRPESAAAVAEALADAAPLPVPQQMASDSVLALYLKAMTRIRMGKKGPWVEATLAALAEKQDTKAPIEKTFGRIAPDKEGIAADAAVAAALAGFAADRIKDAYGSLK